MSNNFLDDLSRALGESKPYDNYLTKIGMFGKQPASATNSLFSRDEQTSARIASIASRGLQTPESLTLTEIKAVCASALTQAPNRN